MIFLIILLSLIACAFFLNALYKRTNAYQNQFVDVRKFSVNGGVGNKLEIVNLGSNHPKFGFDYKGLDIKGENWAVGPQTFEYDFTVLRKNASHLSSGAVVVIPVCLLKFFLYRQKNRAIHIKYYSFLKPEEIVGYSKLEKLLNYEFPLLSHPGKLRALLRDSKKDNRLYLSENLCKTENALNKDADKWINGWNKEFGIELPNPTLLPRHRNDILQNINILNEMITFCDAKGLRPVIAILPVTENLYSRFNQDFIDKYILGYIADANKQNIPVLNYLHDTRFTSPELYINSFFFNSKGRKKFTKQFIEDLRAQSIL